MFENAEIPVEGLPAADTVDWQPLGRRYSRKLQIQALINTAILAAAVLVATIFERRTGAGLPVGTAWLAVALLLVAGLAWPLVSVPKKGFAVREHDVLYKTGVIWQSVTAVPFNRVQHVETGSSPLDRTFDLATLNLYTAGTSGGDLKIHGLPADAAERLRVFVLGQAGAAVEQD